MATFSYYLLYIMFSIAFAEGVLAVLGIHEAITHLGINAIEILLFLISSYFMLKDKKIKFIGFWSLMLLLVATVTSFLINDISLLHMVFFIKVFILPILFLMALLNIPFTNEQSKKILKYISLLFIIQIPAAIIKTSLVGFQEDYMGTVSIEAGSVATILPLIAIAYIFSYYQYTSRKSSLILLPLFIFVSISCSKLGIVPYLLALLLLLYFLKDINRFFSITTIKAGAVFITVSYLILYIFVIMTPRANPDGVVGGRFDIVYALNFANTYISRENEEAIIVGVARKDAPMAVYNIMSQKGLLHILLGFGPGDIVMSSYLEEYYDPLYEKYHLGYGARTGFIWTTMQVGIIGTFFYLLFQLTLFRQVYRDYKSRTDEHDKTLLLGTIGISIIFILDYFTYSTTLLIQPAMTLTYFYIFYYAIKYKYFNYISLDTLKQKASRR